MEHLHALELGLSNERQRLRGATTDAERKIRGLWVAQMEREVYAERERLNLPPIDALIALLTDDELLEALNS